jgi:hypothetical protein
METLDARKTQALFMMLAGETYVFIAKTLNVSSRTVRRWAQEPQFAATLKEESDALASITRAQTLVLTNYNVERGIAASRFLDHVMNADQASLTTRMRAAGQLASISFRSTAFAYKNLQEHDAKPDTGFQDYSAQHQAKSETKQALKEEAATIAKSGHAVAPSTGPKPAEQTGKAAPSNDLPAEVKEAIKTDTVAMLAKADTSGQKRTSEAEHQARRARLAQRDREMEAEKRATRVA